MMMMMMTNNYNGKIVILLMSRDSGTLAELEVARSDPEMISSRSGWLPHSHFRSDGDHDEV